MYITGDYIPNGSDFSASKWFKTTEMYIDKIRNNLTSDNWTVIFQVLHHLEESDKQESRIQVGASLTPIAREPLLPDDPPSD
jgi:hypothetical protein